MLKKLTTRAAIAVLLAAFAMPPEGIADTARPINVPAGNLISALEALSRQAAVDLVFQPEQLRSFRTEGVRGTYSPQDAINILLKGTPLQLLTDADSGAMVIAPPATDARESTATHWSQTAALMAHDNSGSSPAHFRLAQSSLRSAANTNTSDPTTLRTQDPREHEHAARAQRQGELEEIVVTGTLLRNVTPPGTNLIRVTEQHIAETGAVTSNQLLAQIPQLGSFMSPPYVLQQGVGITSNRPNIRGIPGFLTSGGSSTLILFDGHRVVGAGVVATSPDPDIVPPSLISSVEIVPDGGSAIYGSDAVAGVLNFITRSRFDGAELSLGYGAADDYSATDASFTLGSDWGAGSAFMSYNYSKTDEILGRDRDFVQRFTLGNQCDPGTITRVGSMPVTYALPLGTASIAGSTNTCDPSDEATIPPEEERLSLFAGITQDFGERVNLSVRGFYYDRSTDSNQGRLRGSVTVQPTNPFYQDIPNAPGGPLTSGQPQTIAVAFGNPRSLRQKTTLESWAVAPTLTAHLSSTWRLRVLASHSESDTEVHRRMINSSALAMAAASTDPSTAFNPYDPSATHPAVLAAIGNFEAYGRGWQTLTDGRIVADGDLFELPGGAVKLAVGGEVFRETYKAQNRTIVPGNESTVPIVRGDRTVRALFSELNVPIVGPGNAFTGMEHLVLSISGRYDDYSDVGDTTNPRIGLSYSPVNSLTLRGSWSKSFNAPSIADYTGGGDNSLSLLPGAAFPGPGFDPATDSNRPVILLRGGSPDIEPQESTSYSLGFDFEPASLPGALLSATYYNLELRNQIGVPAGSGNTLQLYATYPEYLILNPTQAQVEAVTHGFVGSEQIPPLFAPGAPPIYSVADLRRRNLGKVNLDGIDLSANYVHRTAFGSIDISTSANYELGRTQQAGRHPATDLLTGSSRFRMSSSIGAAIGQFRAQATYQHSAGYDLVPNLSNQFQERVNSFDLVHLYFRYDWSNLPAIDRLSLSLNVDNVFDQDPSEYRADNGFANGFTLGRLFRLGLQVKL